MAAVLFEEEGHDRLVDAIADCPTVAIGASTLVETDMVMIGAFDTHGRVLVERFLERNEVAVISFDAAHRKIADEAFVRYGKGRHPARLNYGDCMTYATARLADRPLLFVGDDFSKTDLRSAID